MAQNLRRVEVDQPTALEEPLLFAGTLGRSHFNARVREAIALPEANATACNRRASAHAAITSEFKEIQEYIKAYYTGRLGDPQTAAGLALATSVRKSAGHLSEN